MIMKVIAIFLVVLGTCQAVSNFADEGRVTGGHEAILGQFPWQVAIHHEADYRCLGVLITERIVLTIADCVTDLEVIAGNINLHVGSLVAAETALNIKVATYIVDPNTDSLLIALETKDKIATTANILAIKVLDLHKIPENTTAQSSGWGYDNARIHYILQYVDLIVTHVDDAATPVLSLISSPILEPNHACVWDRGTGLIMIDDDTLLPFLIGIAMENKNSCEGTLQASTYLSTFSNKDFIDVLLKRP